VEKKIYSLCHEVLRRLSNKGILDKILLVGSWCIPLYENYFNNKGYLPPLRTRDIEFLFPIPLNLESNTDLFELLKDLGFVLDFKGKQGYIVFYHPDLIMEFIVPARGREPRKPIPIKQLGINAQGLRFMDALAREPIQILFEDIKVNIPHPADFALHKLLIAGRRKNPGKADKDKIQAIAMLRALHESGEFDIVRKIFQSMPKSWQKTIKSELTNLYETEISDLITQRVHQEAGQQIQERKKVTYNQ
jgi:hypothetical protein